MEKACLVANIKYRPLSTDDNFALRGQTLADAVKEDTENGLIPAFVSTFVVGNAILKIVCKNYLRCLFVRTCILMEFEASGEIKSALNIYIVEVILSHENVSR